LRLRTALLAAAVLAGALGGGSMVQWLYGIPGDIDSLTAHALRWSAVALAGAATFYLWRSSSDSREQLRRESLRRLNLQQQLTHTRLAALRSQIEPHFLFNTLATLRRLHRTEPEAGARMLGSLIEYLRRLARMPERSVVPLGEEIDLLQAYLAVIEMRMSGRLRVHIDVPAALRHAQVPPLALATLVENAVKHGITRAPSGGEISIQARQHAGQLELCVADTGAGLLLTAVSGTGIGLSNVRSSLATLYGALASLRVEANTPTGVRALLRLPYEPAVAR
jgi:LytS/YehU family sensor histidine kinase